MIDDLTPGERLITQEASRVVLWLYKCFFNPVTGWSPFGAEDDANDETISEILKGLGRDISGYEGFYDAPTQDEAFDLEDAVPWDEALLNQDMCSIDHLYNDKGIQLGMQVVFPYMDAGEEDYRIRQIPNQIENTLLQEVSLIEDLDLQDQCIYQPSESEQIFEYLLEAPCLLAGKWCIVQFNTLSPVGKIDNEGACVENIEISFLDSPEARKAYVESCKATLMNRLTLEAGHKLQLLDKIPTQAPLNKKALTNLIGMGQGRLTQIIHSIVQRDLIAELDERITHLSWVAKDVENIVINLTMEDEDGQHKMIYEKQHRSVEPFQFILQSYNEDLSDLPINMEDVTAQLEMLLLREVLFDGKVTGEIIPTPKLTHHKTVSPP